MTIKTITILIVVVVLATIPFSGFQLKSTSNQTHSLSTPLPKALTVVNTADASPTCTTGGQRLLYGLDYNGDGRLSPYERQGQQLICNQRPVALNPGRAVAHRALPYRAE